MRHGISHFGTCRCRVRVPLSDWTPLLTHELVGLTLYITVMDIWNESAPYTGYFAAWLMWPALFYAIHDLRNHRSVLRTGAVAFQFAFTCAFSAWIGMSFYEWLTGWRDGAELFWAATFSLVVVAGFSFGVMGPIIEAVRSMIAERCERRKEIRFTGLTWVPDCSRSE